MLAMSERRELEAFETQAAANLKRIWNSKKRELGLTQEALAHECGWKSQGAFNQYLNARVPLNVEAILVISNALGVDPLEISAEIMARVGFYSGSIPKATQAIQESAVVNYDRATKNVVDGPSSKGLVPLISWIQAGDFCEAVNLFEVGDAERWLPCPVNHSDQTYILRVQGTSMEPEYRDGDLIFVDPHVQPIHNSDIIVRLETANTATFKRLQIVGSEQFISPINPEWPEPIIRITESAQICGVVIFSGRLR